MQHQPCTKKINSVHTPTSPYRKPIKGQPLKPIRQQFENPLKFKPRENMTPRRKIPTE